MAIIQTKKNEDNYYWHWENKSKEGSRYPYFSSKFEYSSNTLKAQCGYGYPYFFSSWVLITLIWACFLSTQWKIPLLAIPLLTIMRVFWLGKDLESKVAIKNLNWSHWIMVCPQAYQFWRGDRRRRPSHYPQILPSGWRFISWTARLLRSHRIRFQR